MNRFAVEALAEWIAEYAREPDQIGLPDVKLSEAAEQLRLLVKQRAELLDALKMAKRELEEWAEADGLDPYNHPLINKAIENAEGEQ